MEGTMWAKKGRCWEGGGLPGGAIWLGFGTSRETARPHLELTMHEGILSNTPVQLSPWSRVP